MATPKLRFKEFDGDWSTNKIEEISIVTSGGTPSRNVSDYWNGDIPWVTTSLVDFNVINEAEEFITQVGLDNSSAKLFPKDTILMAMYGQGITRGKVAILGIDATTNQACAAIKLKNGFETKFIFQNLMNRYEEIRDLSNEGGQKNLSAGIIKEILISFPEKEEQTKIASFLSNVDEKISQLTQKHELLNQYKQGMMQKLFSQQIRFKADDGSEFGEWEEKNILKIADVSIGLVTTMTTNYREKGTPLIRNSDIKPNNILKNKLIFLDSDFADSYENRKLKVNDIVTVHTGDVGVSSLIPEELNGAIGFATINTRVIDENVSPCYLVWYFNSKKFINWCVNYSTGDGRQNLNLKDFNTAVIPLPSLEEQTKIANLLSAIDQKVEVVAQQIEQAKQWKKGLLQQMFV